PGGVDVVHRQVHGHEVGEPPGGGEHGVAEREIGERGEQPAVAEAARVQVPLLDAQAERDLLALAALVEGPDQLVEGIAGGPLDAAKAFGDRGSGLHRPGILASNQVPTTMAGAENIAYASA